MCIFAFYLHKKMKEKLKNALLLGIFLCAFSASAEDFELIYSDVPCPQDALPDKLRFFLFDDESRGYIAPCIASGERDFAKYFHSNVFVPCDSVCKSLCRAEEKPKPERVIMRFTITKTGETANIAIQKGVNPLYDQEAFRLVRELRFSNPAYINGKATEICVTYPILFDTRLFCPK